MAYFDCINWSENGYSESDFLERLNIMGDQLEEFNTNFAHLHSTLYYTKAESDALFWNFTVKQGDYDTLDGYHATEITGMAILLNGIYLWAGEYENIPINYKHCDGENDTPNLVEKQIVGAGNSYAIGDTGGTDLIIPTGDLTINDHILTIDEIPKHNHSYVEAYSDWTDGSAYPNYKRTQNRTFNTENTGGSEGHNHTGDFTGVAYDKSGKYIKLLYIKKVT